jgi:D-alanyl-lipoteichoic acid acyltransferase DltB (MBOAT superfamily)
VLGGKTKSQNVLLLIGSYFFYAWWDWRFLALIIAGSLLTFIIGKAIHSTDEEKLRKRWLRFGLAQGLGGLLFFKYYNFFVESFADGLHLIGLNINPLILKIIVPLGISFYTFRILSYLFDIKNKKIEPTKDWVVFFTYVAFFPTFISGPIDRARTFVPQLLAKRDFNYESATNGMRQILWGLVKKLVVADNLSTLTNHVFENYQTLPASALLIGAFSFALEVYADFSGYSDMAIGVSRLLGFNVTKNFDFPYFAQNIADFWRKWHISLTSWLTEYLFTPLTIAFRDYDKWGIIMAIIINMMVVGFWHGASWTFIVFGFIQGCYFIPIILRGKFNKKKKLQKGQLLPTWQEAIGIISTFTLIALTDVLFRAESLSQAIQYYKSLVSISLFSSPALDGKFIVTAFLVFIFIVLEWIGKDNEYAIEKLGLKWPTFLRWSAYVLMIFFIGMYMNTSETPFIYFKF